MESPAWLPRREVKPPPTSTEAGVVADAPPLENSAGNNANSSCSIQAPTILDLVRSQCSLTRILNAVRYNYSWMDWYVGHRGLSWREWHGNLKNWLGQDELTFEKLFWVKDWVYNLVILEESKPA